MREIIIIPKFLKINSVLEIKYIIITNMRYYIMNNLLYLISLRRPIKKLQTKEILTKHSFCLLYFLYYIP